jgi:hypothetical protein
MEYVPGGCYLFVAKWLVQDAEVTFCVVVSPGVIRGLVAIVGLVLTWCNL